MTATGVDMSVAASTTVLRSLGNNGQTTLTADKILSTCTAQVNSITLGSR